MTTTQHHSTGRSAGPFGSSWSIWTREIALWVITLRLWIGGSPR
jgi:hypothetical protein